MATGNIINIYIYIYTEAAEARLRLVHENYQRLGTLNKVVVELRARIWHEVCDGGKRPGRKNGEYKTLSERERW